MEYACRKCEKESNNYFDAIGWFCDFHFEELINLIDNFIQPERSKREDLDCCNKVKKLEYLHQLIINENIDCGEFHRDYVDICEIFNELIRESKMRCSEHCGNTMRDK